MKSPVMSSLSPVRKRMPSQASGRNSISSWTCLYAACSAGNASQPWPVNLGERIRTSATETYAHYDIFIFEIGLDSHEKNMSQLCAVPY